MRKLAYGDIIRGSRGDEHMVLAGRLPYERTFKVVTIKSEAAFTAAAGAIRLGPMRFPVGKIIDFNERWDYLLVDE